MQITNNFQKCAIVANLKSNFMIRGFFATLRMTEFGTKQCKDKHYA